MLMPKRVKYRKMMRGRMRGKAQRGAEVHFGEYGLKALEPAWISARQLDIMNCICPRISTYYEHRRTNLMRQVEEPFRPLEP